MTGPATRSYGQLCAVAAALDVIGERWALLIVRDLMFGPLRFVDLAEAMPGAGTNTLTARLKQLESAGVIERALRPAPDRSTVYRLTAYGRELEPIILELGRWGMRSMDRLPPDPVERSRAMLAALLTFRNPTRLRRPVSWELRLTDGVFAVQAVGAGLTIEAGAPDHPDHVVAIADRYLLGLLDGRLTVDEAVAGGLCDVSDPAALPDLLALIDFRRWPDETE